MAYTSKTWVTGEVIQAVDLNHAEQGIATAQSGVDAISANGAIGTANLANASVTNAKLDQGAVDTSNIANGAIGTTEIQDGAVTRAKLADAALSDIAAEYSSSSTYAVGDYVFHSGALYRCVTAITTAEAWTAAHWTQAALGNDVADLKSATGVYSIRGIGTQAVKYTETTIINGIAVEAFTKYKITISRSVASTYPVYGYLKDQNATTLMACNIPANQTVGSYEYMSAVDLTGCSISFQVGEANITAAATVEKIVSVIDDLETYEEVIPFTTTSGYIKANGTIGAATADAEVYTNKIFVSSLQKIRYALIYPSAKVLWLKAQAYYMDGTQERIDITDNFGDFAITSNMESVAFTYRTYGSCSFHIVGIGLKNATVCADVSGLKEDMNKTQLRVDGSYLLDNPFEFTPVFDHLFVSRSGTWVTIPHQSLPHYRISRLFGAKVIETNILPTSDGVYVVNHMKSGKFGNYFHHVDGTTDISNISVSSVTWDWIVQNVRYNSNIPKYRTRPPRLEEVLSECKQQNIIPLVGPIDTASTAIVRKYMGNRYVAYNGTREENPDAMIFMWRSFSTKEAILNFCSSIGKPLIFGIGNIGDFSDNDLKDIIDVLHENGYLVACAYVYDQWAKYASLGIDVNGGIQQINRINYGNVCNLESLYGFGHFIYTNATETDGVLTFTGDGTIAPDISNDTLDMCAVDLELDFTGSITIPVFGEHVNATTINSDGTHPYFQSTPIFGGSPKVTISVSSGTIIRDMKYKASKI